MLFSHFCWMSAAGHLGTGHLPSLPPPSEYQVRFYRSSTDSVQQATLVMTHFEFLVWSHGMLMVGCHWKSVGRLVQLRNLIVHNRHCFGVQPPTLVGLPEHAHQIWTERLRLEYQRSNEFHHLLLCVDHRRLARDVLALIFRCWRTSAR